MVHKKLRAKTLHTIFTINFFILLLLPFLSFSQGNNLSLRPNKATDGNIYALIIGISEYQDENIKDLRYAHKDAEEFKKFLLSKNGGSVPNENITFLVNEKATISNIYASKMELENKLEKGDRFYFYFSGHGDVESSLYKLGFLIAYDTPFGNYLNNAVRIEDINIMANTLSIQKDVEVILITDACHSGKLAGSDNRGKMLIGEQLSKVENQEVRIASCESNELSQEDKIWGGGRGAFSYYLIKGLNGEADEGKKNGIINLYELKNYVASNVMNDVMQFKEESQSPVVEGKNNIKLSVISEEDSGTDTNDPTIEIEDDETDTGSAKSIQTLISVQSIIDSLDAENLYYIEYDSLHGKTESVVLDSMHKYFAVEDVIYAKSEENPQKIENFKLALVTTIHNFVQNSINLYLASNQEELLRRQYFVEGFEDYDNYVKMLELALELVKPDSELAHIIEVKKYYYDGLNHRLQMYSQDDPEPYRQYAIEQLLLAHKLDSLAPYVNNELGILYLLEDIEKSAAYFETANELAPSWSIPYSNLSSIYLEKGDVEKSLEYAKKSLDLNNQYYLPNLAMGKVLYKQENYLYAEDYLKKSLAFDDNLPSPKFYLGHVYSKLFNFDEAEVKYYEAMVKTMNYKLKTFFDVAAPIFHEFPKREEVEIPPFDDSDNFIMNFCVGYIYYNNYDYETAISYFHKALTKRPNDPLANRYIAESYYRLNQFLPSQYYFEQAKEFYVDSLGLATISESLQVPENFDYDYQNVYLNAAYEYIELIHYLGKMYSTRNYFHKAEEILLEGISLQDYYSMHLIKQIYIQNWELEKADSLISNYPWDSEYQKFVELYDFYKDVIELTENPLLLTKYAELCHEMSYSGFFTEDNQSPRIHKNDYYSLNTYEHYERTMNITNPSFLGIEIVKRIDFLENVPDEILSKVYSLAGDLYTVREDRISALQYYKKGIEISTINCEKIYNYVEYADDMDYTIEAFEKLYFLDTSNMSTTDQLPLYIDYLSKKGNHQYSDSMIQLYNKVTLENIKNQKYYELLNAYNLQKYIEAEVLIRELEESDFMSLPIAYYSLARVKMKEGKKKEAISYLEDAVENGFNKLYVLKYDDTFTEIRQDERFITLQNNLGQIRALIMLMVRHSYN